jgi:signal peptidase I
VTIAGAVAIVLAIKAWVVNPYRIPSSSMEPTLHCAKPAVGCEASTSDRVLANRFIYHFRQPRRGEIDVFTTPKLALQECGSQGTFVKRLIGVPGDVWEERTGVVYINGKSLNEPYIQATRRDSQTLTLRDIPPRNTYTRIPKGYYLMMGDNRSSSCDSRRWGLVPRKNLIGKVFATYWPPKRISFH